jgi:hypothetical protein
VIFSWNAPFLVQLLLKMELWSCGVKELLGLVQLRGEGEDDDDGDGGLPDCCCFLLCFSVSFFVCLCFRSPELLPLFLCFFAFFSSVFFSFSAVRALLFFFRPFSGFYKAREGLVSLPPEMVGIVEARDHGRIVGIVAMICWIFPY